MKTKEILITIKQFILTILCLCSYVVLPALLVAFIVLLFALVYAAWNIAYIFLSSL